MLTTGSILIHGWMSTQLAGEGAYQAAPLKDSLEEEAEVQRLARWTRAAVCRRARPV